MQDPFELFRQDFPAYQSGVYVNHAAVSPLSYSAKEAMDVYWTRRSDLPVDVYPDIMDTKALFKQNIATLVGADNCADIALTDNTSRGLNIVASGLNWHPGDRIILNRLEFPANVYPFMNLERLGVEIDWVTPVDGEIRPEDIFDAVRPQTRMVSISFVQFLNGFRADLGMIGRFCHENDILFVVDGIQGVGIVPMDVRRFHIDALATGGHKWLMWPMGLGFLYLSPELREKIYPVNAGWLSVKNAWDLLNYDLDFLDSAECFELGTLNFMGLTAAHEALTRFHQLRIERIHERILGLTDRLIRGVEALDMTLLTPKAYAKRAGIISIRMPAPEQAVTHLQHERIYAAVREGVMRFSIHCTNNEDDIDRILAALADLVNS